MNIYKTTRVILIVLCTSIMAGCISLSIKDYNPFDRNEPIVPEKERVEVKYSTNIGANWSTEVALGAEAEYVNVGFSYRPDRNNKIEYANSLFYELDTVVKQKKYQQLLDSQTLEMTNLWTDIYSFKLDNIPISYRWASENEPSEYAINLLTQKLCWYISMQMISESKSTTLNTQRNFYSISDKVCIQNLKTCIYIFPYLTASKLATTTNSLEYSELLNQPAVWKSK